MSKTNEHFEATLHSPNRSPAMTQAPARIRWRTVPWAFAWRRLMRAFVLACAGLLTAGVMAGQATQTTAASKFLVTAYNDALARVSVHETETEVDGGRVLAMLSDDVSVRYGRQNIKQSNGVRAKVRVAGADAYISGNQKALVSYFGFQKPIARKIGKHWVQIPSSNRDYATVAADATMFSALSEATPSSPLVKLPARELDGQSVIGIRGNLPSSFKGSGPATLYFTASAQPLPVSATIVVSGHKKLTFKFDDWGESVPASLPTNAIPISKLQRVARRAERLH